MTKHLSKTLLTMGVIGTLGFTVMGAREAAAGPGTSTDPILVTTFPNNAGGYASGWLANARATAGNYVMGCTAGISTSSSFGFCYATGRQYDRRTNSYDLASGSCYTEDAKLISLMNSIGVDSYVAFSWDAGGNCTTLQVEHSSKAIPLSSYAAPWAQQ